MSISWSERIETWQAKNNALQIRERVLLFVVAVVLFFFVMQWLFLDPMLKKNTLMSRQYQQAGEQLAQKSVEKQQLEMILAAGVNKAKLAERDKLKTELQHLDEKIQASILTLIPPRLMPQVLEKLLLENNQLKLISLENKPVVVLIDESKNTVNNQAKAKEGGQPRQALYKHSFILRLEGNYASTVEYFEALSTLPWRFNWDALHYEVTEYPKANITLEVHTVSLSEDWIGV